MWVEDVGVFIIRDSFWWVFDYEWGDKVLLFGWCWIGYNGWGKGLVKCGVYSEDGEEGELDRYVRLESGYW